MKKTWLNKGESLFLAPILLGAVLFGIWVSVAAAINNYRFARAIDQLLNVAAIARDFSADPRLSLEIGTEKFLDRLQSFGLGLVPSPNGKTRLLPTPWGTNMQFVFSPQMKLMRLETGLSSVGCKKTLTFLASDPAALGLRRIDISDIGPTSLWRNVYQDSQSDKKISPEGIKAACSQSKDLLLGLNFQTK